MTLTAAGLAEGLSLSTFASNFPTADGIGPLGIAFPGNGVMVSDFDGTVFVFPSHADGQNAASASQVGGYGFANSVGLAQVGQDFYMSTKQGAVFQLNPNGTFNQTVVSGLPANQDIRTDPVTNHLIVSTQNDSIYNVDPVAKTKTLLANTPGYIDGLTITPDGKFIYVADVTSSGIREFDATTGALVGSFALGKIAAIDGLSLGFGAFANDIFANTNNGDVYEINFSNPNSPILIASGGSRGDFVTVDPIDSSLLLTQTNSIVRLTAPAGSGFGPPPSGAPEPSSLTLVGTGIACLCGYGWRRRKVQRD